jgi:tetratricopeptide (TPR) repeat protein
MSNERDNEEQAMKQRLCIVWIALCAAVFSCASTGGGESRNGRLPEEAIEAGTSEGEMADLLSLEEAIEQSAAELTVELPARTRVAIAALNQAIKINPNSAFVYYSRGFVYFLYKEDNDRAIAGFNQAIRLDPNSTLAYKYRGSAYYNKGDYRRARADWEQALRFDPNDADVWNNLMDKH